MKKANNLQSAKRAKLFFYSVMFAVPLLQFIVFYIGVNFNSLLLVFQKIRDGETTFAGFENIVRIVKDLFSEPIFKYAIRNSLVFYIISLLFGTSLALFFSFYIFKRFPLWSVFRVFLFVPQVISSIVMVILFTYMVELGIPTLFRDVFGVQMEGLLENASTTFGTIVFFNIWVSFGTNVLLYVGSMNNISDSVVEYAKIDGANYFQEFIYIILPLIYPTIVTFIIIGLAGIFTNQMNLFSFYGKSAEIRFYTFGYYFYVKALKASASEYPYLASLGVIITLVIAPVTIVIRKLLEKFGPKTD